MSIAWPTPPEHRSMPTAVERIVVQASAADKLAIVTKARQLDLPISELMRRGAFAYAQDVEQAELEALASAAQSASERACAALDDALAFIKASERRIQNGSPKVAAGPTKRRSA
jgi:hypothetical protein